MQEKIEEAKDETNEESQSKPQPLKNSHSFLILSRADSSMVCKILYCPES